MITLESVSQVFPSKNGCGPVRALDAVSVSISAGEFVSVTGPSGSGKSTLLFTIGAMLKPTSGKVRLGDTTLYDLPAKRRAELRQRQFGFVFQTFNLLPYLTCRDNVALPAMLTGAHRREARERAEVMLQRLGLGGRLSHRPSELSVGERQRVAFCRSLINRPVALLADEPTGNLDPAMTDQVVEQLLEIHAAGQTIVLVTHNHDLAQVGTRVIHLRDGRIESDAPTHRNGAR